ncbi:hypothetical protein PUN28_013611 [Cardiocondyla obscurior]|uniref:Uncharacterized protein n=1 Tax=Cardiocondyla obscurior TaxID=286306 RepID=A0AAW2F3S2_9HYME
MDVYRPDGVRKASSHFRARPRIVSCVTITDACFHVHGKQTVPSRPPSPSYFAVVAAKIPEREADKRRKRRGS